MEDDVTKTLMAISTDVAKTTNRINAIICLELINGLKWLSALIEMELQDVISRIRSQLERDDRKAFCNVSASRAVLHSSAAEVCCSLSEAINVAAGFHENIAVVERERPKRLSSIKRSMVVPEMMVLRASSEVISAFEIVIFRNKIRLNYF